MVRLRHIGLFAALLSSSAGWRGRPARGSSRRARAGAGAGGPPPPSVLVDPLAADDLAAPGARLDAAALDQLLEPLEVRLDRARVAADLLSGRLDDPLRLPRHHDVDAGAVGAEALEPDVAGVLLALRGAPGDVAIRLLVRDLGAPLLALAADLGDPAKVCVVQLRDGLDVLHELRELLELRPLVVRGRDRDADLDRFLDFGHAA